MVFPREIVQQPQLELRGQGYEAGDCGFGTATGKPETLLEKAARHSWCARGTAKGASGTSGARSRRPREPHGTASVAHTLLTPCWHPALGTARSRSGASGCPQQGAAAGAHMARKGSPASSLDAMGRGQCCRRLAPSVPQDPVFPFLARQAAWQLLKNVVSLSYPALRTMLKKPSVALGRVSSFRQCEAERCSGQG